MSAEHREPSESVPTAARALGLAVWLVPAYLWLFAMWFTWKYAVDVPHWDAWELVELVTGRQPVTAGALWAQANEHRIVLQRLIDVAWARVGGWNQWAEAFFPILLIGAAAVVFIRRAVAERDYLTRLQRALLVMTLSFWFFTLRQTEVLLWGILTCWGLLVLVFVLFEGCWFRHLRSGGRGWPIVALVLLAVLSTGQGLALCAFLVGAGVCSLVARDVRPGRVLWTSALGGAVLAAYFVGFHTPPGHPSVLTAAQQPVAALQYLLVSAGSPFFASPGRALAAGVTIAAGSLAALVALARARRLDAPWEVASRYPVFVIGGTVMVAVMVGRVGFGVEQATSSRYVPFAVLFSAGALLLVLDQVARSGRAAVTAVLAVALAVTVPAWYLGYRASLHDGWVRRDALGRYRDCALANPDVLSRCDGSAVYPNPVVLAQRMRALREHRLSLFRGEGPAHSAAP